MKRIVIAAFIALLAAATVRAERPTYTRNVAIVLYENAEPLDWAGPFEVYNDAASFGSSHGRPAFHVYIVSKTKAPLDAQGMHVVPSYSIDDAPKPDLVVFPGGPSQHITDDPEFFAWARKVSNDAEIAQSVCTGAFVLGKAGLLDGLEVTTFHGAIEGLRKNYEKARVEDGRRFVDNGHVVTTAGISAGIDGSLNVVARLLGRRVADEVATYMEYHWTPEAYLATKYVYLNPSTDESGRALQTADMQVDEKNYGAAIASYRAILANGKADTQASYGLGIALRESNDHLGAANAFATAAAGATDRHTGWAAYQAAREFAQASRSADALPLLAKALESGVVDRATIAKEPTLASLHEAAQYKELVAAK